MAIVDIILALHIWVVLAYLIGSIPFGLILTRLAGLGDIRAIGSGNIGATNVLRTGNKKLAALTLLLDAAKGAVVVLIARQFIEHLMPNRAYLDCIGDGLCGYSTTQIELAIFLLGVVAMLGHMFPVWLKFKGGKGVATFFGIILAYSPYAGLLALATWLVAAKILKRSSVAALISTFLTPVFMALMMKQEIDFMMIPGHMWRNDVLWPVYACVPVVALVWWRHKENIKRILNGTEPKIGKKA